MSLLASFLPWTGLVALVAALFYGRKSARLKTELADVKKRNAELLELVEKAQSYLHEVQDKFDEQEAAVADATTKAAAIMAAANEMALRVARGEASTQDLVNHLKETWDA